VLVVDASIAVDMALVGRRPPALEAVQLVAPTLLWCEATSTIHELGFRREVDPGMVSRAISILGTLGIEATDPPGLHLEAARLAALLGWAKTYDAEYVALARITGTRLLTRDARLRRGARRVVDVLGPVELDDAAPAP
jgi:predicted nucleic acid-binding protein